MLTTTPDKQTIEELTSRTRLPVGAPTVSVVVPTLNEERNLPIVFGLLPEGLHEVIVVDGRSTDDTVETARRLRPDVKVVLETRKGKGAALQAGFAAATGEIIVMLDADGSYTAADIPAMVAHFPAFDQVNGARTSEEGTMKLLRVPAKWVIRKLACYLARTPIPDLNTGLKAFKRSIMLRYLWVVPDGFSCVTSMTLAFLTNGHAVKYLPTVYKKRIGKSKFHPINDTRRYLATVVRMVMYFKPLRVFGPIALVLFLGAIVKTVTDLAVERHGVQESTIIVYMTAVMVGMLGLLADLIVAQKSLS